MSKVFPLSLISTLWFLIYARDPDFVLNWKGNKAWMLKLEWKGQEGFRNTADRPWGKDTQGIPIGEYGKFENLVFLKLSNVGHLA